METTDLTARLGTIFSSWVDDDESDVVACELVDRRWAVRMSQQTRDFTTVWVDPGERTVGFEAYVLPSPGTNLEEIYRQLLFRNLKAWRVHFAVDKDGEIYLRGRIEVGHADEQTLGYVFAEIYELIELSFRPLLAAARG